MSAFKEYTQYDGVGLAELARTRQVSPLELIEEAIQRAEALNPRLNAIITPMYEQARKAANTTQNGGIFAGVPILLKDLIATVDGVPTSNGNRWLKDTPARKDSELVRRYKSSGAVILGKTNTPEFGLTPYTEPETFGATRNPWNLERTPGGSSGGSAAAVAAGIVPIAHGGDGGGSIRIPASCCGLFGMKPTRGRTPSGPDASAPWQGFAIEHVLTRSVRDSAGMLDATTGLDTGAPYACPPQERPFLEEVDRAPGKLIIAFTTQPLLGRAVDRECVQAVEHTARLLESLGHEVVEDSPQIAREETALAFATVLAGEMRADIEEVAQFARRTPSWQGFDRATYTLGLMGKTINAVEFVHAVRHLQRTARQTAAFFTRYDVLLTPTLASPPFVIGSLAPSPAEAALMNVVNRLDAGWILKAAGLIKQLAAQVFEFIPYTPLFNFTGQPAMSMPMYWTADNLPVGVQFAGRFGDEATLFRLAGQLEKIQPWFNRLPPLANLG